MKMPKKKLFNGSNYVGAPVSDDVYNALWNNAVLHNKSVADVIRSVLTAFAKSPRAAIPQDKLSIVENKVKELKAQRKSK